MRLLSGVMALLGLLVCVASPAMGQYPNKPIHLVVPFPPGGSSDYAARVVAQPLAQALGQPIVIDNKPGADGAIAGEAVRRSAPDGYTLLFGTSTGLSAVPNLRKEPPYDPLTDFTPISRVGTYVFFVVVHADVPAKTVSELLAYVRTNPSKLSYGTGNGTSIVAIAQLARLEKLNMVHVPYKGDGPLSIDFVAGRVQMMFATPGTLIAQAVRDGKARMLATLQPKRSPLAPEVPSFGEAGLPKLAITPWVGLLGPAKLPREIVERLAHEMKAVMARPEIGEQFGRYSMEAQSSSPEELGAFLREQLGAWRQAIRDAGIQPN